MLKRKAKEVLTILLAITILFGFVPFHAYAETSAEEIDKIKPVIDYAYVENGKLLLFTAKIIIET